MQVKNRVVASKLPAAVSHEARRGRPRGLLLATRAGKVRPVILLWALGVPLPLLVLFFLIRGCSL